MLSRIMMVSRRRRVAGDAAWLLAAMIGVGGLARHAFASDANCERTVTRTWDPVAGGWVYWDSGCVQTQCGPDNPCKEFTDGQNGKTCGCQEMPHITRPCVKRVVYSGTVPVAASCYPGAGCASSCDPIWTPLHGSPQALNCPCP